MIAGISHKRKNFSYADVIVIAGYINQKILHSTSNCVRIVFLVQPLGKLNRKEKEMETTLRGLYLIIGAIVVALLTTTVVQHKLAFYKEQDKEYNTISAKVIEQRLNCMAQNIYREAGHEPFEGKVAVAQVTLNRVEDPRFPKDVCAVVYQKNVIMEKVVCQFSWFCDSKHKNKPINKAAYNDSMEVAKKVMLEGFRLDGVKTALYYHADYINPNWKLRKVAKIGTHIFYEDYKGKD